MSLFANGKRGFHSFIQFYAIHLKNQDAWDFNGADYNKSKMQTSFWRMWPAFNSWMNASHFTSCSSFKKSCEHGSWEKTAIKMYTKDIFKWLICVKLCKLSVNASWCITLDEGIALFHVAHNIFTISFYSADNLAITSSSCDPLIPVFNEPGMKPRVCKLLLVLSRGFSSSEQGGRPS